MEQLDGKTATGSQGEGGKTAERLCTGSAEGEKDTEASGHLKS